MRNLTSHVVEGDTAPQLKIFVLDEPGAGGAHHWYAIDYNNDCVSYGSYDSLTDILFQNGPIKEHGVNGITVESLLAICLDRMECFQAGPFQCQANAMALDHIQSAMTWLQKRTVDRIARGVEGKSIQ